MVHGVRIDSTLVGGTIDKRTCCCWTGMSRPALCAIGRCLLRKPAAAGITTTNRTLKTGNNLTLTTGITSKDMTNRQINKLLQIPKLKKTMKRENVLSMMAVVLCWVSAQCCSFPETIPNHPPIRRTLLQRKPPRKNCPLQQLGPNLCRKRQLMIR